MLSSYPILSYGTGNSCFLIGCDVIIHRLKVVSQGETLVDADLQDIMVGRVFGAVTAYHEPALLAWATSTVTFKEKTG